MDKQEVFDLLKTALERLFDEEAIDGSYDVEYKESGLAATDDAKTLADLIEVMRTHAWDIQSAMYIILEAITTDHIDTMDVCTFGSFWDT